jgi:hypothetical protein
VTFVNASFEIAGTGPGEAAGWTWVSATPYDEFADFNAALPAHAAAREGFEAGWRQYPRWTYADAAARTGAGGFTAADLRGVAWQVDEASLWVLLSVAPTWQRIETAGNEEGLGAITARPLFAGSRTGSETFERWTAGRTVADPVALVPANDPGVVALGAAACGLRGAADSAAGSVEALRAADDFEEGWGEDPWTGTVARPLRRGAALAFPLIVPPERARLWVWSAAQDRIAAATIVPGLYATPAALCGALLVAWTGAGLPAAVTWVPWAEGDLAGVALAWDAAQGGADVIAFAWPDDQRNSDARGLLGFPAAQAARWPLERIDAAPAAFAGPFAWVDAVVIAARTAVAADGGQRALPPTAAPGSFDGGDREDFAYGPWTGGGTWIAALHLGTMTAATWSGGGDYEGFENAAATWPDYYEA